MKYRLSKDFAKSLEKLGGKELRSALAMLDEVEEANSIHEITDCKKLVNFANVYRIRVGARRAFFTFHVEIIDDIVFFRYLVSRGQAYDKIMEKNLRSVDEDSI